MNINLVTQYPPSTARVESGAENKPRENVGTPVARETKANAASERPIDKTKAVVNSTVRVELKVDEATGRVVGRVVDTSTDKVVRELPPEDLLRYLEKTRELFDEIANNNLGRAIDKRV